MQAIAKKPVRVTARRLDAKKPAGFDLAGAIDALRPAGQPDLETDLRRVRWLADLLDTKFSIGGVHFGVEGIIGLLPGIGDFAGALLGVYPIWVARRHKVGRVVQARMAVNLLIEMGVGTVPVVGDLFDIAFKANIRNVKLLERAVQKGRKKELS